MVVGIAENMWRILFTIDGIQDYAVDSGQFENNEVFNLSDEEETETDKFLKLNRKVD